MNIEMVQMMIKLYKAVHGAHKPYITTLLVSKDKIVIDATTTRIFIDYPECPVNLGSQTLIIDKKTLEQMGNAKKDIVFTPSGWSAGAVSHIVEWEYYKGELVSEELDSISDLNKIKPVELDALDFKKGVQAVKVAVAQEDTRPVLCNIAFSNNELVGIDGFRIHTYKLSKEIDTQGTALISKPAFSVLEKIINKKDSKLLYAFDGDWSLFQYGNVRVYSHTEGEYMDYKSVFNKAGSIVVKAYAEELYNIVEAIRSEKLTTTDGKGKVQKVGRYTVMSLPADQKVDVLRVALQAASASSEKVEVEDSIPVDITRCSKSVRENLDIKFNPEYLSEAIKPVKDKDEISLSFEGNVLPLIIEAGQVKNLVLPYRFK